MSQDITKYVDQVVKKLTGNSGLIEQFKKNPIKIVTDILGIKLDDQLNPADSVSIPISPTHYQRIHPRIRRMTGLDEEVLAGAPSFREALTQFSDWCGTDYVLLTWGCDDVSVLAQNIDFFQCGDIQLAPLCDIQRLFSDVHHLKDRSGLKTAIFITR